MYYILMFLLPKLIHQMLYTDMKHTKVVGYLGVNIALFPPTEYSMWVNRITMLKDAV
jgi:hypothetical protein